jgi:flagella basal body P-ring formation protein FlgA
MARCRIAFALALGLAGSLSPAGAEAALLPPGVPLTAGFTEELIGAALQANGAGEQFELVLEQPRLPLANQASVATEVTVEALRYEATSGRFDALLVGMVGGQTRFRLPARGRARALIALPVLARPLAEGERVGAEDVAWIRVLPARIPPGSLTAPEQIVGAEARRNLEPRRALSERDLGPPRLVVRGQSVRLVYRQPGLRLTALGVAQADGALGERVRVVNLDSRRQLEGVVSAAGEVALGPTGASVAQGAPPPSASP